MKLSILLLMICLFCPRQILLFGQNKLPIPKGNVQTIAHNAKWIFGQNMPSNGSYLKFDQDILFLDGDKRHWLGLGVKEMAYFSHNGDFFLVSDKFAPHQIQIFRNGSLKETISVQGIPFLCSADFNGNELFLSGLSDDQSMYLFQVVNQSGTILSQKTIRVENKTPLADKAISYSVFFKNQWIVWLPANLSLIYFDRHLKTQKTTVLKLPSDWTEIDQKPFQLLSEKDPQKRHSQCETLLGSQVHALPATLFIKDDHLYLGYWHYYLNGCERINHTQGPPFETGCRTSLARIPFDHPKKLQTLVFEETLILGLAGNGKYASQYPTQEQTTPWRFKFEDMGKNP